MNNLSSHLREELREDFEIFELTPDAGQDEVTAKFIALSKIYYPASPGRGSTYIFKQLELARARINAAFKGEAIPRAFRSSPTTSRASERQDPFNEEDPKSNPAQHSEPESGPSVWDEAKETEPPHPHVHVHVQNQS